MRRPSPSHPAAPTFAALGAGLALVALAAPMAGLSAQELPAPGVQPLVVAIAPADSAKAASTAADTARPAPAVPATVARPRTRPLTVEAVKAPVRLPLAGGVGPHVLHVQVLLAGAGFSPGVLDGHWAANTRGALRAFREAHGLGAADTVDAVVYERLRAAAHGREPVVGYTLTAADLRGPFRTVPEDSYAKARLDCLCYGSVEEKLAERFQTSPGVLRQLNPGVDFAAAAPGTLVAVPNMWRLPPMAPLARLVVDKQAGGTTGYDSTGAVLLWFPSSTGTAETPSPTGELQVRSVTLDPWYRYSPVVLKKGKGPVANLPPGPNSPVGTVWIQLSRAHIGIHGTPEPHLVGRRNSNGCVRLTNWDARFLAGLVQPGLKVELR